MRGHEYFGRFEFKLPRSRVEDALKRNPVSGVKLPIGGKTIYAVFEVELSRNRPPFTDLMMGECAAAQILNLPIAFPGEAMRSLNAGRPLTH